MLWHRAADAKGMTLREFLKQHNSLELAEIEARDRVDPYDVAGRIELGLAKIASLLFNAHRDVNKSEALPTSEFLPEWGSEYRDQAEAEVILETETAEVVRAKLEATFGRRRNAPCPP